MNKWIKQGTTSLIIGAATFAALTEVKASKAVAASSYVDAVELDGGSKLKDRMVKTSTQPNMIPVRILLDV